MSSKSESLTRRLPGHKLQRDPVITVTQTCRCWAIFKHVTLMPAATFAMVFRTRYDKLVICFCFQMTVDKIVKARPSRSTFVLCVGREQRKIASRAGKDPIAMFL